MFLFCFLSLDSAPAAAFDECPYLRIKLSLLHHLFDAEVHSVSPIMTRVGRYIDAFAFFVGISQPFVHCHPILPGYQAKHGRGK